MSSKKMVHYYPMIPMCSFVDHGDPRVPHGSTVGEAKVNIKQLGSVLDLWGRYHEISIYDTLW